MNFENCKMVDEDRTSGLYDDDVDDDVVFLCTAVIPHSQQDLPLR